MLSHLKKILPGISIHECTCKFTKSANERRLSTFSDQKTTSIARYGLVGSLGDSERDIVESEEADCLVLLENPPSVGIKNTSETAGVRLEMLGAEVGTTMLSGDARVVKKGSHAREC